MYHDSEDAIEYFYNFFSQSCSIYCPSCYNIIRFSIFSLGANGGPHCYWMDHDSGDATEYFHNFFLQNCSTYAPVVIASFVFPFLVLGGGNE